MNQSLKVNLLNANLYFCWHLPDVRAAFSFSLDEGII